MHVVGGRPPPLQISVLSHWPFRAAVDIWTSCGTPRDASLISPTRANCSGDKGTEGSPGGPCEPALPSAPFRWLAELQHLQHGGHRLQPAVGRQAFRLRIVSRRSPNLIGLRNDCVRLWFDGGFVDIFFPVDHPLGDSRKSACGVYGQDFRGPQTGRSFRESRHDRSRDHGLPAN